MDSAMPAAHQPRPLAERKNERSDWTWNETVLRLHLPATALMECLVITTGDTVDNDTSCATSHAKKGFQRTFAVDNRGLGEPSLVFEEGQELVQVMVLR
ncbi:MAG TPA: hypothetical protein VIH78_07255 [Terriglobales bacterium]